MQRTCGIKKREENHKLKIQKIKRKSPDTSLRYKDPPKISLSSFSFGHLLVAGYAAYV